MNNNFYYCERTNFDVFGEPLNFITNFSFILVSVILFLDKSVENKLFSIIIFFIGIGSLLFHSFVNKFTAFLDVLFIAMFIFYYLLSLYDKLNITKVLTFILPVIFLIICYLFGNLFYKSFIGTSAFYLPIVIHLLILYFYLFIHKNIFKNYKFLLRITLIFALSIFLRSIDLHVCNILYTGTHFLWHMLNAIFLFYLVKFYYLIPHRTSPKKPS